MNVLWLCNVIMPEISSAIKEPLTNTGGWLTGISSELRKIDNVKLGVIFPCSKTISTVVNGISCYGLKATKEEVLKEIIREFEPDIIHVFGTESLRAFQMISLVEKLGLIDYTVISIQGMVSIYEKHYFAHLPQRVIHKMTLRDIFKWDSIFLQHKKFVKRGITEIKAICKAKYVIGRTDWDEACTKNINPEIKYYHCNEILRTPFYINSGVWEVNKCERHSIFVSQCGYPIKGFHLMLEAMRDIVKKYPDAMLYTTGNNLINRTLIKRMRSGYYQCYLRKLIQKYGLENNVIFLGNLNEIQMCEAYLRANVFVCCSSIENSPNSLGEAMLLGVPCVTADVGGVRNMITDKKEGFVYPYDEPYMCAYYVMKYFECKELVVDYTTKACLHAKQTYDPKVNCMSLYSIYKSIRNQSA